MGESREWGKKKKNWWEQIPFNEGQGVRACMAFLKGKTNPIKKKKKKKPNRHKRSKLGGEGGRKLLGWKKIEEGPSGPPKTWAGW